ncbi:glycosyltransferase [Paenibacillus sp. R14(2021)]|uniref:glycosyltransferase n=1 Tax=Paenibacillus sp. R14(2021) TaxID=2859228 RepID=UPI001C6159E9|nr:glycosyltransferase [Paenibacillus sp. R14(2021)]
MKSVLFIAPSLRGGGAERVIINLLKHMSRSGVELSFIALKLEGPYVSQLPDDVEAIDLNTRRVRHSIFKLTREINRIQPDVVLSTLGHLNLLLLLIRPFLRKKPKLVLREANAPSFAIPANSKGRFMKWLYRILYPRADRIIALSSGMAEDLIRFSRLPAGKVTIIHNPVVTEEVNKRASQQAEHAWITDKQLPVCISVGRLVEQKNYDVLLRAFALVQQQLPCRLIVLGEGKERAKLEGLRDRLGLTDKVDFHGFASNPFAYVAKADLFVLSSRWEGMPNVLLEALAVGIQIVSTDCIGVDDVLDGGKYGAIVPVGGEAELASAIARSLSRQDAAACADRQKSRAAHFNIERISNEYRRLLLEV